MDILSSMPVMVWSLFQKQDMHSLSWSEMISKGNLFSQYHLSKNVSASSLAVRVEVVGMICILDLRQSVKVMIVSNPLSTGRGPMKLIATESHWASGMGKECRGPTGLVVSDLFLWQSEQDGMWSSLRSQRM